jgi:hypothetical protein
MDAIVSGVIRKPEADYYRNAKWMAQLLEQGKMEKRRIRDPFKNLKQQDKPRNV